MASIIDIPESGTIEIKIGSVTQSIDAYRVHNLICDARDKINDEDKPIHEFHAAIVEILKNEGLPGLNHFQADCLATRLEEAVDALGKTVGAGLTPDLPASTEQASSTNPPGSS